MASFVPSYHHQPSNHPHYGYRRINTSSIINSNNRYRLLQSSLATLIALRDTADCDQTIDAYQRAITRIQREMRSIINVVKYG